MKAKLTIDGKEFEVEISEEQAKALTETKKRTGYERREKGEIYYVEGDDSAIYCCEGRFSDKHYEDANYYSDKTVAENNARADKLYRQLRRFAVEHRENKIDWNDKAEKYYIYYNQYVEALCLEKSWGYRGFGLIFFDTRATAKLAIDTFKDELLWYFTEYKDSL